MVRGAAKRSVSDMMQDENPETSTTAKRQMRSRTVLRVSSAAPASKPETSTPARQRRSLTASRASSAAPASNPEEAASTELHTSWELATVDEELRSEEVGTEKDKNADRVVVDKMSEIDQGSAHEPTTTLDLVPFGPPNPDGVRERPPSTLSVMKREQALISFKKLKNDLEYTDEQAFFKLLQLFNVPVDALQEICHEYLPYSFSNVKYSQIAGFVNLDPSNYGRDIIEMPVFRSRVPAHLFETILNDLRRNETQYGPMGQHENEETRSRYIASVFLELVCVFRGAVRNRPEEILESQYTKKERIEHHYIILDSLSIVFFEVKKVMAIGKARLDVIAQALAESLACDYLNAKLDHWVPVLGVICDGEKFEFLVYDSVLSKVYTSNVVVGLVGFFTDEDQFVISAKKTAEYLFDYFIIGYINGLKTFAKKSMSRINPVTERKRESTSNWQEALRLAQEGHRLCRNAAKLGEAKHYDEADEMAFAGVETLKESVGAIPNFKAGSTEYIWNRSAARTA